MARFPENDISSLVAEMPRYDLAESIGPDLQLRDVFDAASLQELGELALSYGTSEGNVRLRELLAQQHNVSADDIVVTVGGMHALFLLAFLLCNPGDEALTTAPSFPLARNTLTAVGAQLRIYPLSFEQGYQLEAAELGRYLSPQTKLVSLASPQNPSGVAIAADTVREILAEMNTVCPDAYLLIDETYRAAVYGDDEVMPSAVQLSAKIISCASLSKCHGAPGLRLGWAITRDAQLRQQLVTAKLNTVISCSAIDEALAIKVLEQQDHIIAVRRQRLHEGLAKTAAWVQKNAAFVDWLRPDAGALCCLRLKPSVFDDNTVAHFYKHLAQTDVRVANGAWFGEQARVFRLGFGLLSMTDLEAALNGLTMAIEQSLREAA